MDADRDGFIEQEVYVRLFAVTGADPQTVLAGFRRIDSDGDGRLTTAQFLEGVAHLTGPDRAVAHKGKAPPGGDRGQSQCGLGQAETIANALAGARAERNIGAAVGPGGLPPAGDRRGFGWGTGPCGGG